MRVAVLGAKVIGATLGRKWVKAGHSVMFGVRNVTHPDVQSLVRDLGGNTSAGTVAEAITFGEIVLFAIPGAAMEETIRTYATLLKGKIVIDAANKVGTPVMNSLSEFGRYVPEAIVYRAFNSLGWENFEQPQFGDDVADLFYCGPAGPAQTTIETLIHDIGLRPVRVGDHNQAASVDAVAGLWFALAFGQKKGRHLAFKVLTR